MKNFQVFDDVFQLTASVLINSLFAPLNHQWRLHFRHIHLAASPAECDRIDFQCLAYENVSVKQFSENNVN